MSTEDKDSSPTPPDTRTIKVDYLARVEGEGAMYLRTRGSASMRGLTALPFIHVPISATSAPMIAAT